MTLELKSVENGFDNPLEDKDNAPFVEGQLIPTSVILQIFVGGLNTSAVGIIGIDGHAEDFRGTPLYRVWLSDDADGVGLTTVEATGNVDIFPFSGEIFSTLTPKKAFYIQQTDEQGEPFPVTLRIQDDNKTGFYIAIQDVYGGLVTVSRQLTAADYG